MEAISRLARVEDGLGFGFRVSLRDAKPRAVGTFECAKPPIAMYMPTPAGNLQENLSKNPKPKP